MVRSHTDRPDVVTRVWLEQIHPVHAKTCARLQVDELQAAFIPSPAECVAELQQWPQTRGVALLSSDGVVGLSTFGIEAASNEWKIFRFLVDKRYQGRGYGTAGLDAVLRKIATLAPRADVRLCYHPANDVARRLYRKFGFIEIELQPCARTHQGKMLAIRHA